MDAIVLSCWFGLAKCPGQACSQSARDNRAGVRKSEVFSEFFFIYFLVTKNTTYIWVMLRVPTIGQLLGYLTLSNPVRESTLQTLMPAAVLMPAPVMTTILVVRVRVSAIF